MATEPVIVSTQSVLGFAQWQAFAFQPGAINTPTAWVASSLPPGVSIDGASGLISGAASLPGVYVISVTCSNSAGSNTATFTIGIEAAAPTLSTDLDVTWDLLANKVTLTSAITPAGDAGPQGAPLTLVKYGADLILSVTVQKAGSVLDLDITGVSNAFTLSLKELEGDGVLVASDAFQKLGTGGDARYRVHVALAGDPLKGALSNYPDDKEEEFAALCELILISNNPLSGTFGPSTLTLKSDTFSLAVANNLA
jgi:hypothetical protein